MGLLASSSPSCEHRATAAYVEPLSFMLLQCHDTTALTCLVALAVCWHSSVAPDTKVPQPPHEFAIEIESASQKNINVFVPDRNSSSSSWCMYCRLADVEHAASSHCKGFAHEHKEGWRARELA
eukprot:1277900-Amphidinium_carterae.1